MADSRGKPEISVEALLKLKRLERPDDRFWETFERDFERRRLQALAARSNWRDRLLIPSLRALALAAPVLLVAGVLYVRQSADVVAEPRPLLVEASSRVSDPVSIAYAETDGVFPDGLPEMTTSLASSQFVLDAIQPASTSGQHFRKVLYSPAIRVPAQDGSVYVRDSFSPGGLQVTTADLKLGRNF